MDSFFFFCFRCDFSGAPLIIYTDVYPEGAFIEMYKMLFKYVLPLFTIIIEFVTNVHNDTEIQDKTQYMRLGLRTKLLTPFSYLM